MLKLKYIFGVVGFFLVIGLVGVNFFLFKISEKNGEIAKKEKIISGLIIERNAYRDSLQNAESLEINYTLNQYKAEKIKQVYR